MNMKSKSTLASIALLALSGCANNHFVSDATTTLDVNEKECTITEVTKKTLQNANDEDNEVAITTEIDFENSTVSTEITQSNNGCPLWLAAAHCFDRTTSEERFSDLSQDQKEILREYRRKLPKSCTL